MLKLENSINNQSYDHNPFTFVKRNNNSKFLFNQNSFYFKENKSTKKRPEESKHQDKKSEKFTLTSNEDSFFFLLKKKVLMKKAPKNETICFTEKKDNHTHKANFLLFNDRDVYSSEPYNDKVISMITDEDVSSDDDIIEKANTLLSTELQYGIVAYQQQREKCK